MTDAASGPVVAGVLAYQDAATIGSVVTAVRDGLAALDGVPAQIVLADAGSTDGTIERAREALVTPAAFHELEVTRSAADRLEVPYHGIPGKARALRAVLVAARDLGAPACVVFDGGVQTLGPDWVGALARPVVEGVSDFVSPRYARRPFEGALTKGIVYPLIRAIYGVRLHQPAAAEFACSARLADVWLRGDVWERSGAQVGIDIWLATAAVSADFRIGEAALGVREHGARGEEALDLATTIAQVVGALFTDVERHARLWQRPREPVAVARSGEPVSAPPDGSAVDLERLLNAFRFGFRELSDVWTWVLPPRTIVDLNRLLDRPASSFQLDDRLWARIVYDFVIAHRLRVIAREHLLRSLVPLYSGWLASYVIQVGGAGSDAADRRVEALASAFESEKPYLMARWRWPERLRTG